MSFPSLSGIKEKMAEEVGVRRVLPWIGAWAACLILGQPIDLLHGIGPVFFFTLLVRLGLLAGIYLSVRFYAFGDLETGYRGFKAFLGYGLLLSYTVNAVAASDWRETGKIGWVAALVHYGIALLLSLPVAVAYFTVSTNAYRIDIGVLSKKDVANKVRYRAPRPRTIWGKILDNADAIIYAVILVSIIHSTLFQLYVIPTESMVPRFLVGDRVIVTKLQSGPRVPLSPLRVPVASKPKRGDIIVFDNPFEKKAGILRRMANTGLFYLSFSFLNTDRDKGGRVKVSQVVKRLVGLPGEKLLMVDDVLYKKTKADPNWVKIEAEEQWARPNLYREAPEVRRKIRYLPIDEASRASLDAIDSWKNNAKLEDLDAALLSASAEFRQSDCAGLKAKLGSEALAYLSQKADSSFEGFIGDERERGPEYVYASRALSFNQDMAVFCFALSSQERLNALVHFLSPTPRQPGLNPYDESAAKLNSRIKWLFAQRCQFYYLSLKQGRIQELSRLEQDGEIDGDTWPELGANKSILLEWQTMAYYMKAFYTKRNFPEFPGGDSYIDKGKYFLMGDNRYNSLDFRFNHDNEYVAVPLEANDPTSVIYMSDLDMSLLSSDRILGKVLLTIWPPRR